MHSCSKGIDCPVLRWTSVVKTLIVPQIHSPPDIPDHNYGCGTPGSWLRIAINQVHNKVQAHPEVVEGSVGGEKEIADSACESATPPT